MHVRHLDFSPAEGFSSLLSGKKISFHRPLSASKLRWNLVKRILDHLWAILVVYMCIFLKKFIEKLDVDARRSVGRCTKRLGMDAAFASKPVGIQRKREKGKETVEWGSQTDICGERCLWQLEENEVYVCVFVRHGLRSTSFVLGDATKSGVSHFSFIHLTLACVTSVSNRVMNLERKRLLRRQI